MLLKSERLLASFRGLAPCEACGRFRELHPHHFWFARGMGGGSRLDHPLNLIGLCARCHDRAHLAPSARQALSQKRCLRIVARREGVKAGAIVEYLEWLARQPKERNGAL